MIRLALLGPASELQAYSRVSSRLRHASLDFHAPATPADSPPTQALPPSVISVASVQDLLGQYADRIDAVLLLASPANTPRLLQTVIAARKHVLVRAPLADSHSSETEILQLCRTAPVQISTFHPLHSLPSVEAVITSLERNQLGVPGLFRLHRWTARNGDPEALPSRFVPEIGLALKVFRSRPTQVFSPTPNPDQSSGFQVHLGFPGNGMAVIDCWWTLPPGATYFSMSVIGSTGAAYADDHHNASLLFTTGRPTALRVEPDLAYRLTPVQQFVDSLAETPQAGVAPDTNATASQVAEAALEAARERRTAFLNGDTYELR